MYIGLLNSPAGLHAPTDVRFFRPILRRAPLSRLSCTINVKPAFEQPIDVYRDPEKESVNENEENEKKESELVKYVSASETPRTLLGVGVFLPLFYSSLGRSIRDPKL